MSILRRVALLALAACLAVHATAAAADEPPGRLGVELGLGAGQGGAPALVLGAAIGVYDGPARRVDLRGRLGVLRTQEVGDPGLGGEKLTYNGMAFIADVAHAWRFGRLEPWVSIGVARLTADLDDPVTATGPTTTDRATVPVFGAGARLVIGGQLLLALEGLLTPQRDSKMTWLSQTPSIGGGAVIFTVGRRFGAGVAHVEPPSRAESVEPPPPAEPAEPGEAPPPLVAEPAPPPQTAPPSAQGCEFALHAQRAYRCQPNPVAGGFLCAEHHLEARFLDAAACERACRGGEEGCRSASTGPGAACARCVEGCRKAEWLACTAENGGERLGPHCRIDAGRWGAATVMPVECR